MSIFNHRHCHALDNRYQLYQQLTAETLDEAAITDLIQRHPKLCSIKYDFRHPFLKKKKMICFPLARIMCFQPSLDLVKLAYKAYPEAIREKDNGGRCPLHFACRLLAPKEVVLYLISENPHAVGVKASDGTYPLHKACGNLQPLEIIEKLVECGKEEILQAVSKYDLWTPLHFATRHKPAPGVIPYLLELYPEAAKVCSNHGRLPLHHACWSRKPLSDIESLMSVYPDGVMCLNDEKSLPLHNACHRQSSIDVIQYLVKCFPEGVTYRSLENKTPLEYALEGGSSDATIQFLGEVTKELDSLEKMSLDERQKRLDDILESVLRETAKAAPKSDSNGAEKSIPSEPFSSASDQLAKREADRNEIKLVDFENVETTIVSEMIIAENPVESEGDAPEAANTQRPMNAASNTAAPGAVWVRGPDAASDASEGAENLCNLSDVSSDTSEQGHLSSANTVVTRTPIAAEISPRVAELEAQLEDYRRRLDVEVVEADEVLPPIDENQAATTKTCCTIL